MQSASNAIHPVTVLQFSFGKRGEAAFRVHGHQNSATHNAPTERNHTNTIVGLCTALTVTLLLYGGPPVAVCPWAEPPTATVSRSDSLWASRGSRTVAAQKVYAYHYRAQRILSISRGQIDRIEVSTSGSLQTALSSANSRFQNRVFIQQHRPVQMIREIRE